MTFSSSLPQILGSDPGALDPTQESRVLHEPGSKLTFATYDPRVARNDNSGHVFPDLGNLSIQEDICRKKRIVIETTTKGFSYWRWVPRAIWEQGVQDEGEWPKQIIYIDAAGPSQFVVSQDQWDIHKLDPAYECIVPLPPNPPVIRLKSASYGSTSSFSAAQNESHKRRHTSSSPTTPRPSPPMTPTMHQQEFNANRKTDKTVTPRTSGNKRSRRAPRGLDDMSVDSQSSYFQPENVFGQPQAGSFDEQPGVPAEDVDMLGIDEKRADRGGRKRRMSMPDTPSADIRQGRDDVQRQPKRQRPVSPSLEEPEEEPKPPPPPSPPLAYRRMFRTAWRRGTRDQMRTEERKRNMEQHLHDDLMKQVNERQRSSSSSGPSTKPSSPPHQEPPQPQPTNPGPDKEYDAAHAAEIAESIRRMQDLDSHQAKDKRRRAEQEYLRQQQEEERKRQERARERKTQEEKKVEERRRRTREQARRTGVDRAQGEAARAAFNEEMRFRLSQIPRRSGQWQTRDALNRYIQVGEQFDKALFGANRPPPTWSSLPWPSLERPTEILPQDINWTEVDDFFRETRYLLSDEDYKELITKSNRRFHPDRWSSRGVLMEVENDNEATTMSLAACTVSQVVTNLWKAATGKN